MSNAAIILDAMSTLTTTMLLQQTYKDLPIVSQRGAVETARADFRSRDELPGFTRVVE